MLPFPHINSNRTTLNLDPEIFELEIDDSDWFEGGTSALPMDHRGATAAFLIAYAVPICACVILSLAVLGVLIYVGISLSNSANMNKPSDYRSMPISYVISQVRFFILTNSDDVYSSNF